MKPDLLIRLDAGFTEPIATPPEFAEAAAAIRELQDVATAWQNLAVNRLDSIDRLCRGLAEREATIQKLREALDAVQQVANRSDGIAGWHLNGDIATWDSILPEVDEALSLPSPTEHLAQYRDAVI